VENFTLKHAIWGSITWLGLSDLRGITKLSDIAQIDALHVQILHPRFQKRKASVCLKECWTSDCENHNVVLRYLHRLQRLAESWKAKHVSFQPFLGEWRFNFA